jgi:hypothetical protein
VSLVDEEAKMTVDTLSNENNFAFTVGRSHYNSELKRVARFIGYGFMVAAYAGIFLTSFATLGLIEIRQANLKDFNALIAMLEQRDRYNVGYYDNVLMGIQADRRRYQDLIDSVTCTDTPNAAGSEKKRGSENAAANQNAVPSAESTAPKSCADVKAAMYSHVVALSLTEDSVLFRKALLNDYYDKFIDGITERTPNIIPVMRILDAKSGLLALWARLPFEILEMFLLVCMGALGGVISVTRGFVDPSTPNPSTRDLCYRPVAGAVIALGIYVLFRASQLFFGGPSQDAATTVTTSIFVLAGLGLASGFCASEAVRQIEFVATRILRRSEGGGNAGEAGDGRRGAVGSDRGTDMRLPPAVAPAAS